MKFWGKDENVIKIECDKCNKIYKFDKKYFSQITDTFCIPNTIIKCPCGNSTNETIYSDKPITISKDISDLHCPHCGSSQITVMKRGWKWTTGFIGMSKNQRVCMKCLHKW